MMTFATDQNLHGSALSVTSQRMLALREAVIDEWQQQVRQSLPEADAMRLPILINTLPAFYDNIAEALTAAYPRATGDGTSLAAEHGGGRARFSAYSHQALIREYQLFRAAIFNVLEREGLSLTHAERLVINASIDGGIRESVDGFTLAHTAMREMFAAALTHDMRTPLGIAVSVLELCNLSHDPVRIKSLTGKALDNLRRMDQMIGDLLHAMSFAGGQAMHICLSQFDIMELVREVAADAVGQHGPRLSVSGPAVIGWWGRPELKRAIENIVSNALKYGEAGGPVTLNVTHAYERVLLSVHNEGEPIPFEEQAGIFQMYRRVEAAHGQVQGWGIGLPYVRSVIESHGGSVLVDSSKERGTTFTLDFPQDARAIPGLSAA